MNQHTSFTILIADDHPLFRESLALILSTAQHFDVCPIILQADNASSTLRTLEQHPDIDLILTDLDMPGMDGLALIQQLKRIVPDTAIVMISGSEKHADVQQALRLGAKGFIPKSSPTPVMLAALQLILAGGSYLPPLLLESIVPSSPVSPSLTPAIKPEQWQQNRLTERQQEILFFLQQGLQNKAIAHALDLSEATVKVHVRGVFSVLGVKNRTQAVQKALEIGIL